MAKGRGRLPRGRRRRVGEGGRGRATRRCSTSSRRPTRRPSRPSSDFAAWLEKDLAPRSNGSYAIGEANFSAKLRYDDMVEMPLSEVLARGEANLAKDYAAFVETAQADRPLEDARPRS